MDKGLTYDVLIVVAEKDFIKLNFAIDSIKRNLHGFNSIHVISNRRIPEQYYISDVECHLDRDVVDFDWTKFKGNIAIRKGWYVQQFIKLFQQVTLDNYLVVDADVYLNRKIDIFEDEKPVFLLGKDQNHSPYFQFMERMFGFGRVYPYSFINEIMFFKREIIRQMIASTGWNMYGFFAATVKILNSINHPTSSFSEYELYGNYITKYFPDTYIYKTIKTASRAKHTLWTREEIKQYIDSFKDSDIDKISMHSWIQ